MFGFIVEQKEQDKKRAVKSLAALFGKMSSLQFVQDIRTELFVFFLCDFIGCQLIVQCCQLFFD